MATFCHPWTQPGLMDVSNPFETLQSLDSYQGEIFRLYIVLNKTASEVIAILRQNHNFHVS